MAPDRMVALFTGDSITDMGRRSDAGSPLGSGYVQLIAQFAATQAPWLAAVNTGVSGDRSTELLNRWEADVTEWQPDILTVLVGINDTWRRFDSARPTTAQVFRSNFEAMLTSARDSRNLRRLVIMEPFLVPVSTQQRRWHAEDLDAKISITRELARTYDAVHIPLDEIFSERADAEGPHAVVEDGVHPTVRGHQLIAQTWWDYVVPEPAI